ncbi:MAG: hypothetical protein OXG29_10210 [Gammaproteobacteria bacterium]|nr:hypothetical protein [Gammaproteobacteria bacterium]
MKVLVSDTSVLIDVERGSLFDACFGLPFDFVVPDLLYQRELKDHGGPDLIQRGLRVEALDGSGVVLALGYRRRNQSLSLPDSFALALASVNSWILLSGDGGMRELAHSEGVTCHGVLWLIDQVYEHGLASADQICSSIQAIASHPRCRLPKNEIRKRIRLYCGS